MKGLSELGSTLTGVSQGLVTAMQQLRIHRAMCQHWGFEKLSSRLDDNVAALGHSLDALLLAVLTAEHTPDLQGLGRINVGQTVEEIFQSERRMATDLRDLTVSVQRILPASEALARRALEDLVFLLTTHVVTFDQSLELIRQMGIQNFLATRA